MADSFGMGHLVYPSPIVWRCIFGSCGSYYYIYTIEPGLLDRFDPRMMDIQDSKTTTVAQTPNFVSKLMQSQCFKQR